MCRLFNDTPAIFFRNFFPSCVFVKLNQEESYKNNHTGGKIMKKITITALAILLIATMGIGNSFAGNGAAGNKSYTSKSENGLCQNDGNGPAYGLQKRFSRPLFHKFIYCVQKIDINDEISDEIAALIATYRENQIAQNEEMKEAMSDYWVLLISPVIDETALASLEDEILALKAENLDLKFQLALDIRSLLDEESLSELIECFDISTDEDTTTEETVAE